MRRGSSPFSQRGVTVKIIIIIPARIVITIVSHRRVVGLGTAEGTAGKGRAAEKAGGLVLGVQGSLWQRAVGREQGTFIQEGGG